jgi:radical SAM protein with 4Fe4S-binding SPASM domain
MLAKEYFNDLIKSMGIDSYKIRRAIKDTVDFIRYKQYPMFRKVVIETSSYCNRKCSTCPVAYYPRKKEYMDEATFKTIVSQLAEINFSGVVSMHMYNEPLADPTIIEKVHILSSNVPNATIRIDSNGDYLTIKLLRNLIQAGLKMLVINQYEGKINEHTKNILNQLSQQEEKLLTIRVRVKNNFIGNRAGSLSNTVIKETLLAGCDLPYNQLVVNYKGEVLLCCNDYHGDVVLGKVCQTPVMDIWSNHEFKRIRKLLKNRQRTQIKTCKCCNIAGTLNVKPYYLTVDEINKFNKRVQSG